MNPTTSTAVRHDRSQHHGLGADWSIHVAASSGPKASRR